MNGVLLNVVVENFDEAEVNHEIVRRPTPNTKLVYTAKPCRNEPARDFDLSVTTTRNVLQLV